MLDTKHRVIRIKLAVNRARSTPPSCTRAKCSGRRRRRRRRPSCLFHNHPSGDPTPSSDDLALTTRMVRRGRHHGDRRRRSPHSRRTSGTTRSSRPGGSAGRVEVRLSGCEDPVLRLLLGCVGRHDPRRADRRGRAARRDPRGARQPVDRSRMPSGPSGCSGRASAATKFQVRGEDVGDVTRITTTRMPAPSWRPTSACTHTNAARDLRAD